MKTKNLIASIIISSLFLVACSGTDSKIIPETLFDIQNLNNIYVTSFDDKNLNNQGYHREVTDILIYEKKEKDTLTQLAFDNDLGRLTQKTWYIKLDSVSFIKDTDELLYKHQMLALSNYGDCKDNNAYHFPIVDSYYNVFICNFYKEDNMQYLQVTYYNPDLKN